MFCLVFASCYILAAQTLLRTDSTFPRHYFCLSLHIRCAGIAAISECFPSSLLICYRYFLDTRALLRFCPVIVITTFWMRSCDVLECLSRLCLHLGCTAIAATFEYFIGLRMHSYYLFSIAHFMRRLCSSTVCCFEFLLLCLFKKVTTCKRFLCCLYSCLSLNLRRYLAYNLVFG